MGQVEGIVFMGLDYDVWMHISAGVGMALLFLCYWLPNIGVTSGWPLLIGKIVAMVLLCIPLMTRWFLSESLIMLLSCCIIMVSVFFMFLRRRGV